MNGVLITVAGLEVFLEMGADTGRLGKSSVLGLFEFAASFLGSGFL